MSATLYALVVLQGSTLSFSPGYTTINECVEVYKGPHVGCFTYDPDGTTWTAFFKLPGSGLRTMGRIPNEGECHRYIAALKDDIPRACRQLAMPVTCTLSCRIEITPPPAAKPPEPPREPRSGPKPDPAGLIQVPQDLPKTDSFADVSVGPTELQPKDFPALPPKVQTDERISQPAPPKRTAQKRRQPGYAAPQPFDPLGAFVSLVTGRDW
jgi:hypothetical protein